MDITKVPDFNTMYELYDPVTVMFFYRNKHIMIDLGTGNNNKITWSPLFSIMLACCACQNASYARMIHSQSGIHNSVQCMMWDAIQALPRQARDHRHH